MSSLPNNTFASPNNPFYALMGSGGAAASLQSPASVIPDGTGTVSLVGQGTGNGNASLVVAAAGGGTGDAAITVGANGVDYSLYVPGTSPPGLTQGNLYIGQNGQPQAIRVNGSTATSLLLPTTVTAPLDVTVGANTSFSTNPTTNVTNIGNPLAAGNIYLNNPTTITSSGSRPPAGGIVLQQLTPSSSSISQQVASQGVLTLGSSAAFATTLVVSDIPYLGAANYVEVQGGAGLPPLFLSGAQGGAGQCGIHPDAAPGVGQLLLGSDNTNNALITLNGTNTLISGSTATVDADTTFRNGNVFVKGVLSFNGGAFNTGGVGVGSIEGFNIYQVIGVQCGTGATATIPQPTGTGGAAMETGLYMIMTAGTRGGTTQPDCAVSTMAYWNGSGWTYGGGGCAPALISAPPSYFGIQNAGTNMRIANGSGLDVATVNVVFIQLGGSLGL